MSKLKERLKSVNPDIRNNFEKSDRVAQFISDKLKEKNWSKGRLAEELGTKNQSLITRYMSGQHNFTFSTITELERAFGCKFVTIEEVEKKDENPINDENVSDYLGQWFLNKGKGRKGYFMVHRNHSFHKKEGSHDIVNNRGMKSKNLAS